MARILSFISPTSERPETAENPVKLTLDGIDTSLRTGIENSLKGLKEIKEVLVNIEDNTHANDNGRSAFRDSSEKVNFQQTFLENQV